MKTLIIILFLIPISIAAFSQKNMQVEKKSKTVVHYSKVSDRWEIRDDRGMLMHYVKQSKVSNRLEKRDKSNKLISYSQKKDKPYYLFYCEKQ